MKRVIIAAAVVAAAIVGYQVQRAATKPASHEEVKAAVGEAMDDLREKAKREHPGMAESDALKAAATDQATQQLAAQNPADRSKTAASFYMGFHWSNTRVRKEYCDARGIDISAFVDKFESKHAAQLARAQAILAEQGMNAEEAYPLIHDEMAKAIEQDMRDVAQGAQVPLEQSCNFIADNADAIVELLVLPPAVSQALGA